MISHPNLPFCASKKTIQGIALNFTSSLNQLGDKTMLTYKVIHVLLDGSFSHNLSAIIT